MHYATACIGTWNRLILINFSRENASRNDVNSTTNCAVIPMNHANSMLHRSIHTMTNRNPAKQIESIR